MESKVVQDLSGAYDLWMWASELQEELDILQTQGRISGAINGG